MSDPQAVPRKVSTVRALMYVQGALGIIGVIVAIAATDRSAGDAANGSRGGRALFGLIGIGLLVGLFVLATRLRDLRSRTRSWALGIESAIAVLAVLGLRRNPLGSVVSLVMAGVIIALLAAAGSAFNPPDENRLNPRDVGDPPW